MNEISKPAPVQSAYSSTVLTHTLGKRTMRVETDFGMLEVITEADGTALPAISITNFMLGSSNLILDDRAIEHIAYELARYKALRDARKAHAQR